ncbi:hypothetical protein LG329_16190 [Virgibacillus necropolis]|uniref:hypothetical protein n=1 Tax=Virgibacillus necropolis TaxID=163877 RepID=UPI0038508DE9
MIIILVTLMIGLYLVTLGVWELREGTNRKKYITYMTIGLLLIFVFPRLFDSF